ncbi:uncharacterized protein moto [Cyprinodon tularosa]|uniref:uncharacterized protein moto n=1 Tax=Cyprinodon tularosa TaxID=77115 RepID=UPI0018E21743|nr:uncharacterized protein moto [Cyprinodon tularosa]
MASEGHQTTAAKSLSETSQRPTSVGMNGKSGCMPVPFVNNPVSSHLERRDVSWSQGLQDDPYEVSYTQNAIKNRTLTDANCDGEADLQGLVSNILDEADSQDSFYSQSLPTWNPVWSPKTLKEELLQYFPPEPKTFNNSSFISNHQLHDTSKKRQQQLGDKDVHELSYLPRGPAANQQWPFNLPDAGNYSIRPQKLPPGLLTTNKVAADLSQLQQYKPPSMPPYTGRGNDAPLKNFPVLSDIFRPQNDAINLSLEDSPDDLYTQNKINPFFNEHHVPEDMNQLVSSFQSFMPSDHDSSCLEDFPNTPQPTMDMLTRHLEPMQNGEVREPNFQFDDLQDPPEFSSDHREYFLKLKAFPANRSIPNLRQSKPIVNHKPSMNQFSKHHTRQSQKIRSQMEKEYKMMETSGFTGEGFSRRHMAERDKQRFSQNPFFGFQGNMQSQRRARENLLIGAGNVQQLTSLPCSLNDIRRYSNMIMNPNLSSSHAPHINMNGMGSTNDAAAFNSFISDMKDHRDESAYHGVASAGTASQMMNEGGPAFQIHFYLDECYQQCRSLEKERKKTEVILKKAFPGRRNTMMTNVNAPKTPLRLTRVDSLIFTQMKEQAMVEGLFDRMEHLCGVSLPINIHAALKRHDMAICVTQTRFKEDGNPTKQQQPGINFSEDRGNMLMVTALKDLTATTRGLQTAVWRALQMTLPKSVRIQDHNVCEGDQCAERGSSPFQGYSFRF